MQLIRSFNFVWTVRDTTGTVVHRNTSRDEARTWRQNQTNAASLRIFRQAVKLGDAQFYDKG